MSTIPRLWPGETVCCIASGWSLTSGSTNGVPNCLDDVEYVRGKCRVIVVNTSYVLAPWADVLYAADERFWGWTWKKGPKHFEHMPTKDFAGLKYSANRASARFSGVRIVRKTGMTGLETEPIGVRGGHNGGYQSINLAYHFGAARILLLGYDQQRGPKGEEHWHEDHPNRSRSPYQKHAASFPTIAGPLKAAGVEVINCTRSTALTCFPRLPVQDALRTVVAA